MNYASSVAGRTISTVDSLLNRAMTYAWTSTLRHQDEIEKRASRKWRQQPSPEEDFGGGDICSLQESPSTEDDQPLD
jgi:hypothetical protein